MALTQQPKYQYALIDSADIVATEIDIAVLNESDTIARAQLAVALKAKPSIQVLNLARDESQLQPARNLALSKQLFILHKHLMTDLLQSLDRLALNACTLAGSTKTKSPLTAPSTGPNLAERAAAARAAVNVAMPKSTAAVQPASSAPAPTRLRLRALMVDANPTVLAQLREIIESIGMKCDTAKNKIEAMEFVERNGYNIIYVDASTPQVDGYKLIAEIRLYKNQKNAALILLTSSTCPFDAVRGAAIKCDRYLQKPLELKSFYNATVAALSENIDVAEVSSLTRDPTITISAKKSAGK